MLGNCLLVSFAQRDILILQLRILNLELLTLNIYLGVRGLLLRLYLGRHYLAKWLHISLILSSSCDIFLVLKWIVQMHHVILDLPFILSWKLGTEPFLWLMEHWNTWNIWKKGWLLVLIVVLNVDLLLIFELSHFRRLLSTGLWMLLLLLHGVLLSVHDSLLLRLLLIVIITVRRQHV